MAFDRNQVISVLRGVASAYPRAYGNAHRGENTHPEAWDFIILATRELQKGDRQYGMNGKRGNASDPSSDIVAYGSGRGCRVFDVIIGAGEHGNNLDKITCNEVTQQSKDAAGNILTVWIDPTTRNTDVDYGNVINPPPPPPPHPPPPPPVPPYPGDRVFDAIGEALQADMRAAGQELNPQSGTWFGRVISDYFHGGLTIEQSIARHRSEWRVILGLKP